VVFKVKQRGNFTFTLLLDIQLDRLTEGQTQDSRVLQRKMPSKQRTWCQFMIGLLLTASAVRKAYYRLQ